MNDRFRVGPCSELMPLRQQIDCQIRVVVDLTVEYDDDRAIFVEDRLLSATQIDDAQPAMAEAHITLDEIAVIVRTTMRLRRCHAFQQRRINWISCVEIDDPANPAHT